MSSVLFKSAISSISLGTVVLGAGVILALILTNPVSIGPIGVTVWFLGLLLTLAGGIARTTYLVKSRLAPEETKSSRLSVAWRQGLLISTAITTCLALSSLRQLSLRDVILVLALTALVEFYFRTRQ